MTPGELWEGSMGRMKSRRLYFSFAALLLQGNGGVVFGGKIADPFLKSPAGPSGGVPAGVSESGRPALLSHYCVLEVYSLDPEEAGSLMETGQPSEAAYESVRKLEESGKAILERVLGQAVQSGMLSRLRSADCVPLPVSFEKEGGKWVAKYIDPLQLGDMVEWECVATQTGVDLAVRVDHPQLLGVQGHLLVPEKGTLSFQRGGLMLENGHVSLLQGQRRLLGVHGPDARQRVVLVFATLNPELTGGRNDLEASTGLGGQDPDGQAKPASSSGEQEPGKEARLLTKTYALSKTVLAELTSKAGVREDPAGRLEIREVLSALGIACESGSRCSYDSRSGMLFFQNTPENHELLGSLLREVPPGGPGLVRLDYSIYSMHPADARAALAAGGESGGAWKRVKQQAAEKKAVLERTVSLSARSGALQRIQQGSTVQPAARGDREVVDVSTNTKDLPPEGFFLELEPVARRNGGLWDLNARMSLREKKGLFSLGEGLPTVGWEEVRELTGPQVIREGVHSFVGTLNPPDQNGIAPDPGPRKAWLVFVVATPETQ
jgi:hypothetical protein